MIGFDIYWQFQIIDIMKVRIFRRIQIPPSLILLVIFARPLSCDKISKVGRTKRQKKDEKGAQYES